MAILASWKSGARIAADAQKVADELTALGNEVRPEAVVELARNEGTELHRCFEWDDTVAAERYRVHQARQVLCSLVIKEAQDLPQTEGKRLYYKTDEHDGYKPTEYILRHEDEREKLLARALNELRALERKYNTLYELNAVWAALGEIA